MSERSAYERLGGDTKLRAIVDDFIDRVTSDMMIGFFFRTINKQRLKELEVQFASSHLGGPDLYQGRPLTKAHAAHPIMGGHFNRRLRLLDQTLKDHQVPDDVRTAWIQHNETLRAHITADGSGECNDPLAARNLSSPSDRAKKD